MMNKYEDFYFHLYPTCPIVEGAKIDAVYDLQRVKFYRIPKTLTQIVEELSKKTVKQVFSEYQDQREIIETYVKFIIDKNIGYFSNSKNNIFTALYSDFVSPKNILSAIIDINAKSNYSVSSIIKQLNDLRCENLEIRFFSNITIIELRKILELMDDSTIRNVELLLPYGKEFESYDSCIELKKLFPRVNKIIITSSPEEKQMCYDNRCISVIFTSQIIEDCSCCGVINSWYLYPNLKLYMLSQQYNNCLYGKISVDVNGYIKNCPSMSQNFGTVDSITFEEVLDNHEFKKLWFIKKDDIHTCKDCELRYMCQDCRAYITNPNNIFSKPSKCTLK